MDLLWNDLRAAFRALRREPAYAAVTVLILGLGIGVSTATFGVLNGVLLDPLPYPEADRLTMVWLDNRNQGWPEDITSYPNYLDWKTRNSVFVKMAAYRPRSYNLTGDGDPRRIQGAAVPADFFSALGVAPARGRIFSESEEQPGADQSVVVSHGFWVEHFGGSSDALGARLNLSGQAFEVVGVMPPGFSFPEDVRLWTPLAPEQSGREARGALWLRVIGRLKPGATLAAAQAEMSGIASQLEQEYPETNEGYGINLQPLREHIVGDVRPGLVLLMAAVGMVMLIATANLAGLALVRAIGRRQELAIRTVLGAGRSVLVRKLLTETLLLSALGALVGLSLTYLGLEAFLALAPDNIPRLERVQLDWAVVAFAVAVAAVAGMSVGLLPALEGSGVQIRRALQSGGRGLGRGSATQGVRKGLVVAEVALSVMLLAAAMLLVRSLLNLQEVDPGFPTENLLTLNLSTSGSDYAEATRRTAFYEQLVERLEGTPGVSSAAATSALFIPLLTNSATFSIEGKPTLSRDQRVEVPIAAVTTGFFETLNIPLIAGRHFQSTDTGESTPVVIINQTMARQFWPDEDPIGRRITYGTATEDSVWRTIVGVVADVRRSGLDRPVRPSTFLPYSQNARLFMTVVVRAETDPYVLLPSIRSAVAALDPNLPIFSVGTVDKILSDSMAERRFHMSLLTVFSALALILAVSGLYGVVSYSASQRTREIGIRMALGARRAQILQLVFREGLLLTAGGIGLGLLGTLFSARLLESLLFGVSSGDSLTLMTMVVLVGLAALGACSLPARRASRIDPAEALHEE